ncbi:MAG: hypothetical protein LBP27_07115 [Treponema sp.]|jgi:hypothetical protein|nr:hypothetical protein [Treponema sp.]
MKSRDFSGTPVFGKASPEVHEKTGPGPLFRARFPKPAGVRETLGLAGVFLAGSVFLSCATGSFAKVDRAIERGNYSEGAAFLEEEKSSRYTSRDKILYYLDKGLLCHYAGSYEDSSRLLEEGEREIEAAFTKSITLEAGAYLLNDTTREYAGEDYEDIYINSFNALNYYHRGSIEDAMVEIRRMNNKAQYLSVKYGLMLSNLQKQALEESAAVPENPGAASKFTDSALARYLGILFYRGTGRHDDARIDRDQLLVAFANSPNVYTYPPPASIDEELEIPEGMARLNVIGFSGLSPVKKEEVLRIPLPGPRWIKIALPDMEYRYSDIGGIEVVFDDGRHFELELLEDIEGVARETFKEKKNIIYMKTVIRATLKGATSSALDIAADETGGSTGLALGILSLATQIFAEASERADLRISRYFPAKAWAGGINLAPGLYSFRVRYYSRSGKEVASFRYENMRIREGALNLAEAICLK